MCRLMILAIFLVCVFAWSDDFTGVWSNKKDGFKSCGFGLRGDGRGYYQTPIGSKPVLRWKTTDAGVVFKISNPSGEPMEMRFDYNPDDETLTVIGPNNDRVKFWRLSKKEPPDIEAQVEEQRCEKRESMPKSTEKREVLNSRKELFQRLRYWVDYTPGKHGVTVSVRPKNFSCPFGFSSIGRGVYTFSIIMLKKAVDETSTGIHYSFGLPNKVPDLSNLPTKMEFPKAQQESLIKWFEDRNITHHKWIQEGRGIWGLEVYQVYLNARFTEKQKLLDLFTYFIDDLLKNVKPPFTLVIYERK